MKQLDRYIFGKYIRTFLFAAMLFTAVAMIFDFSEKVDDILEHSIPVSEVLFKHYLNYIPYINGQLWPLYAMISVIFFTSRMAYNSEIISILNAGVSFRRLLWPYLMAGLLLGGIYLFANHVIIPIGNKGRLDFEYAYISGSSDKSRMRNVHMFVEPNTKIYAGQYSKRDTAITRGFQLERFNEQNELVYLLKARKAEFLKPPNHWRFIDYEIRTFDGLEEDFIIGRNKKLDTILNLKHQDFIYYKNQKQGLTTRELLQSIKRDRERGLSDTLAYEIEVHKRSSEPFTVLILTIIGVSVASRKVRGGMGLHLALGIGIGATYILLSKFSITFAANDAINPLLGVWIPNLFFTAVAIYLLANAQK